MHVSEGFREELAVKRRLPIVAGDRVIVTVVKGMTVKVNKERGEV
jgi:hypothetical protein